MYGISCTYFNISIPQILILFNSAKLVCAFSTDFTKITQAPVFHVNGDDPEACVRVARLAFEYRQEFNKDVVIDMICYRRRGHNEGDNGSFDEMFVSLKYLKGKYA